MVLVMLKQVVKNALAACGFELRKLANPINPITLQNGQPSEITERMTASDLGVWGEFAANNFSDAFDPDTLQLRSNFLRQKHISNTLHPYYRVLGIAIGQYLAGTSFGSRLMSLYSDSHFGCPHWIGPELPGFSCVCLQHLSYVELIKRHLNIDLTLVDKPLQFIDFGGGYGNMARLLVHLNANIIVDIVDIPAMLMLQKAFLQTTISNKTMLERIRLHHSTVEDYNRVIMADNSLNPHIHFNATFSLNETPFSIRDNIERDLIRNADSFFIAYTLKHLGLDNTHWIDSFCSGIQNLFELKRGYLPGYEPNSFICGGRSAMSERSAPLSCAPL